MWLTIYPISSFKSAQYLPFMKYMSLSWVKKKIPLEKLNLWKFGQRMVWGFQRNWICVIHENWKTCVLIQNCFQSLDIWNYTVDKTMFFNFRIIVIHLVRPSYFMSFCPFSLFPFGGKGIIMASGICPSSHWSVCPIVWPSMTLVLYIPHAAGYTPHFNEVEVYWYHLVRPWNFGEFFKLVTLTLSSFDLGSNMTQWYG